MTIFPFPSKNVPTLPLTKVHCTPTAAALVLKPKVPHKI